jgi:hypothetical protein
VGVVDDDKRGALGRVVETPRQPPGDLDGIALDIQVGHELREHAVSVPGLPPRGRGPQNRAVVPGREPFDQRRPADARLPADHDDMGPALTGLAHPQLQVGQCTVAGDQRSAGICHTLTVNADAPSVRQPRSPPATGSTVPVM